MSETANYKLYLTDSSSERFQDWREKMNGQNDSNMIKIDNALSEKADSSADVPAVLSASAWLGDTVPYVQELPVDGLRKSQNGSISLSADASPEQKAAAQRAVLDVIGQEDGKLLVSAGAWKPDIDIPVMIILLG